MNPERVDLPDLLDHRDPPEIADCQDVTASPDNKADLEALDLVDHLAMMDHLDRPDPADLPDHLDLPDMPQSTQVLSHSASRRDLTHTSNTTSPWIQLRFTKV